MTLDIPQQGSVVNIQSAEDISRVEELAYEVRINQVMTRDVKILRPDQTMRDIVEIFRQFRISGAPVIDGTKIIGVLSIEDLIRCLIESNLDAKVTEYMTTKATFVRDTDSLIEALKVFVNAKYGRLPVIDSEDHLVGIITKGDITRGLLKVLQEDRLEEELKRYRASHLFEDIKSDRSSLILRYNIRPHDFTHGGSASSDIKRALLRLGASPQIARRAGIAVYEAEMNLIIHTTNGGKIRAEIEAHRLTIVATDDGPGIKDVNEAIKPGFSTASDEIRELGFGAGMGLVNISRCTDSMELKSTWGEGTRLTMIINLREMEKVGEGYQNQKEKDTHES